VKFRPVRKARSRSARNAYAKAASKESEWPQVPELRARIGQAGRGAAERYQSIEALAQVWAQLYRHVWWGEPLRLEQTHHFAREHNPRSFTEDSAHGDFWPVPVDDLLPEINTANTWLLLPAAN
jgi:hypothetical protein